MLKKLCLSLALASAGLTAQATVSTSLAHNLSVATSRDVAYVSQEVGLNGTTVHRFSVAPLAVSEIGLTSRKLAQVRTVQPVPAPPNMPMPVRDSASHVLRTAKIWMNTDFAAYKTRLSGWLQSQGISLGYFSYSQKVLVSTATGDREQMVSFVATISANGNATYGEAKLVDADPVIVEATYVPLKAQDDLPDTWVYPNAGQLQWRLLNKQFVPQTGWTTVDTAGAYDAPDDEDATAVVSCLTGTTTTGCPAGVPTVASLMDDTGAAMGVLSYRQRLAPAYEESSSDPETMVAKSAMTVDTRTWDCARLTHTGSFGMVLNVGAEQYAVYRAGTGVVHSKTSEASAQVISPVEAYTVSVTQSQLGGVPPDDVILVPRPEGSHLFWKKDDPDIRGKVLGVAPLVVDGNSGKPTDLVSQSDISVVSTDMGNSIAELLVGTVGNNYWGGGKYDRSVTFNLNSTDSVKEFRLMDVGYDDFLMVAINGTMVFNGPFGGDMLDLPTWTTMGSTSCVKTATGYNCGGGCHWVSGGQHGGDREVCSAGVNYASCITVESGWGENSSSDTYCTNTPSAACSPGYAQTLTTASMGSFWSGSTANGCYYAEQAKERTAAPDVDLRPYLRDGANTLSIRTVVGGRGEFWAKLRVKACSL